LIILVSRTTPVTTTNVIAVRTTTNIKDDTKDDETNDGYDLDDREKELGFTVTFDTEKVDANDNKQEDGDPSVGVDRVVPKFNGECSSDNLQRKHDEPLQSVIPAHGEAPSRVEETGRVCRERTSDGEEDCHLTKSMNSTVKHDTNDAIGDEQRGRTSIRKS